MGTQMTVFRRSLNILKNEKRNAEVADEQKFMERMETLVRDEEARTQLQEQQ